MAGMSPPTSSVSSRTQPAPDLRVISDTSITVSMTVSMTVNDGEQDGVYDGEHDGEHDGVYDGEHTDHDGEHDDEHTDHDGEQDDEHVQHLRTPPFPHWWWKCLLSQSFRREDDIQATERP